LLPCNSQHLIIFETKSDKGFF